MVLDSNQTQGSQACAYGAISNDYYCGIINDPSETSESTADPAWGPKVTYDILDTKVYSYNLIPGDSGGPIFRITDPILLRVSVLGTHVHSIEGNATAQIENYGGWYTPYGWGRESYYQASNYTDRYSVCIIPSC